MRESCIEKAELGFAYLLSLFPWKLSSRPEVWGLRPSSVFPLVLIMARPGSSVSANIYSISSIPFLFLIIASYNRTGFCCSWWRTVGVGRRTIGEPHSAVSTPLWSVVHARRKKQDISRKATQGKDTRVRVIWTVWPSLGKHWRAREASKLGYVIVYFLQDWPSSNMLIKAGECGYGSILVIFLTGRIGNNWRKGLVWLMVEGMHTASHSGEVMVSELWHSLYPSSRQNRK